MPPADAADATELETSLHALLAPYRDALVTDQLYGIHVLHRPGGRSHDWFAGVRAGKGTAKLMLLPIKEHPAILEGTSSALLKRRAGDALFTLKPGDEALLPELEQVVARAFAVYMEET
jgi:hypothetical protein